MRDVSDKGWTTSKEIVMRDLERLDVNVDHDKQKLVQI